MPHDVSLIATIAVGFGLALVMGFAATLVRMPPLVGYLVAGVMIGPATPGFVADVGLAGQLAEIGVMLLMFGVGLHFSVDDLLAVRRIALPGAIVQIVVAVLMGMGTALAWGWRPGEGLVFGLCLSVASTVVLLRALEARGALQSIDGRIAIGWLVVEDLVMVLVLVLLPPLAGVLLPAEPDASGAGAPQASLWGTLAITLLKVAGFAPPELEMGKLMAAAKQQLHEEADYQREGAQMALYREKLADTPGFVVPKLHEGLTRGSILAMSFEDGVSIEEISGAFGWQPHSSRAALSGLRKQGHTIERDKVGSVTV